MDKNDLGADPHITAAADSGPLSGIRIVDLTTVLMGPFATQLLADHGADVIKVETPIGDIARTIGHSPEPGMTSMFQHLNRSKRSVVLDLKTSDGVAILKRLLETADAFTFNMRPSAIARLGLSYEEIRKVNPTIVYCAFTGFGTGGPYAGKPAYDDLIQGLAAIPDLTVHASGSEPRYAPMALADRLVGLYGSTLLSIALLQRARTGQGCAVEVPMFECMSHFVLVEHLFYRSFVPPIGGMGSPRSVDKNRKPFATKDGYICVIPYSDRDWAVLFQLIDRPDLIRDARFADFPSRTENVEALYAILAAALVEKTASEWLAAFETASIAASPMNRLEDLPSDPHLQAVKFFEFVPSGPDTGFVHLASPFTWEGWQPDPERTAPRLGEHSIEVLGAAGFSADQIAAYIGAKVTAAPGGVNGVQDGAA